MHFHFEFEFYYSFVFPLTAFHKLIVFNNIFILLNWRIIRVYEIYNKLSIFIGFGGLCMKLRIRRNSLSSLLEIVIVFSGFWISRKNELLNVTSMIFLFCEIYFKKNRLIIEKNLKR
jgi:hypothetical protein